MSFARRLSLFALAYLAGAELSYWLLAKAGNFSAFWPPAGIYLGMLLATPRARWGAVVLVAAVPNLFSDVGLHGQDFLRALGFLLVNLGAPLVAAGMLRRLCSPRLSFARLAHVVKWCLVVTFISTPLGAIGGATIIVNTRGGLFSQKWFLWWVGDLLGVLALTPLAHELFSVRTWPRRTRLLEAAALLLSLGTATWFIFRWASVHAFPPAVLFLFLLWAALRFRAEMVAAAVTVLAVIALWLTGAGLGPYNFQMQPHLRALMAQVMAATGALLFYILAAVMAERRAAEDELQQGNLRLEEQVRTRTAELTALNAQLHKSEDRYRSIVNNQSEMLCRFRRDGTILFVNTAYAQARETTVEALMGQNFWDFVALEDQPAVRNLLDRLTPDAPEIQIENRFEAAEGIRWTLWINRALTFDAAGRLVEAQASGLDITERKRMEDALRESEERFRQMADNAPVIVWVTEPDATCSFLSQTWYEFTGQTPETGLGLGWIEAVHPDDQANAREIFIAANAKREAFRLEYRLRRHDGKYYWAIDSAVPRLGPDGKFLGYIGSVIDITERKQHEANLQVLAKAADDLNRLTAPDEIMQAIGERVGRFLGVKSCNFTRIDEERDEVVYLSQWNAQGGLPLPPKLRLSAHITEEFRQRVLAGETVVSHNTRTNPITNGEENAKVGAVAFITVPFHKSGKWQYLFSVQDTQPREWRADEIELVRELAQRVFPRLERARAEDALRASHATFRHLVEQSPFGIYVVDADFRLALVGAGAQKVFTNVRPLIGRDFAEVLRVVWPEPFASEATNRFRHTLATGEPYHSPRTIEQRGDINEVEAYDWKIERITLPDGQFGIVCHFYDLSERERYETQLRESETRLQLALASADMGIHVWDIASDTLDWDERMRQMWGLRADDVVSYEVFTAALHPDDRAAMQSGVERALNPGGDGRYMAEYRLIHPPDGTIRWIRATGQVFFENGQPMRLVGTARDITDRKELEAKREQVLIREQQARQLAEEATRAKDDWLAMVTHELRSPLNAMLGYARLLNLRQTQLAPELAKFADLVQRNGERQNELINDLLDTARLATGKLQLETAPVHLAEIAREALETVQSSVQAKELQLWLEIDDDLGLITGDAARLQQVVWNLLTNAVKFTPPGGCVILGLHREQEQVVLTISDTGEGIAPDFLRQVFDRFAQADMSRSRRHGGLGLGLALVKQIVELHGGTITAASDGNGQGATFTVRLPAPRRATTTRQQAKPPQQRAETSSLAAPVRLLNSSLHGIEVLLVEDEADMRELLLTLLSEEGARVRSADTAASAWHWLTTTPRPQLVICDIALPEEDGYSLLARLRQWERAHSIPAIPALALTALGSKRDRLQSLRVGFQMHITKPVDIEELLFVLQSLLEHNRTNGMVVSE